MLQIDTINLGTNVQNVTNLPLTILYFGLQQRVCLQSITGGHLLKLHCPVNVTCNQNFVQLQKHSSATLSEAIVCNIHALED